MIDPKDTARNKLRDAVRRGRIKKPTHCSICRRLTEARLLHGHHEDYDKPLEVKWICVHCHNILDRDKLVATGHRMAGNLLNNKPVSV